MHKIKLNLQIFLKMLKIGAFTFGGGYAMIPLIKREFVENNHYITEEQFTDMIAISEATPGPLAINMATFVGYKVGGFIGALFSTIGIVIPSFIIIIIISKILNLFLDNKIVSALLLGINTGVCILMTTTFISLFRQMKKNILTYIIMIITAVLMLCILYFNLNISSVIIIIIGAIIGIILNGFDKREGNKND